MLFIYPMWDHESQRIGKQKCTPYGDRLHGLAELLGFVGLLVLLAFAIYLACRWNDGTVHRSLWWALAFPLAVGLVAEGLYWYSWRLASHKGFHYDYQRCEASWMEKGERRVYRWTP